LAHGIHLAVDNAQYKLKNNVPEILNTNHNDDCSDSDDVNETNLSSEDKDF
jgi:hypothetical protein